jgi:hypothetical protein
MKKDYEQDERYIQLDKELDKLCDYRAEGKNVDKEIIKKKEEINKYVGKEIYSLKK